MEDNVKHTAKWDTVTNKHSVLRLYYTFWQMCKNCTENVHAVHNMHTVLHTALEARSMVVCFSKLCSTTHRAITSLFLLLYLVGIPLPETAAMLLIYANNTEWQHRALSATVSDSINLIFTGPAQQRCLHTSCLRLL